MVLVGDLVAKGPDSAGVVRWARESGADAVLGNHDAHVLHAARGGDKKVGPAHRAVAETLGAADLAWLESRPLWLRLDGVADQPVHRGPRRPGAGHSARAADARSPPQPAQHHRRGRALEAHRRRALGHPLARPGARRVRARRRPRAAATPLRDGARHRLRLRPPADRARAPDQASWSRCRRRAPTRR